MFRWDNHQSIYTFHLPNRKLTLSAKIRPGFVCHLSIYGQQPCVAAANASCHIFRWMGPLSVIKYRVTKQRQTKTKAIIKYKSHPLTCSPSHKVLLAKKNTVKDNSNIRIMSLIGAVCILGSAIGAFCLYRSSRCSPATSADDVDETTSMLQHDQQQQKHEQTPDENQLSSASKTEITPPATTTTEEKSTTTTTKPMTQADISERLKLFNKDKPLPSLVTKKTGKSTHVSQRRKKTPRLSPRDALSQVEAEASVIRAI